MIVVGDALDPAGPRSKLYDPAFSHGYRAGRPAGESGVVVTTPGCHPTPARASPSSP